MFRLMRSLKISLYCEDVDFFLYYYYFIWMCGTLQNDIQSGIVSPEQSMAACFLNLWSQKNAMPQMAMK